MKTFALKIVSLIFGLFLCAVSIVMSINADLGMAPWDLFHTGVSMHTGLTLGQVTICVSIIIILIDVFALKVKIGLSTIVNMFLIGLFVDLVNTLNFVPRQTGIVSYIQFFAAIVVYSLGLYFYIGVGLGAGPRDSMFIGLCRKYNKSTRVVKTAIESVVFILGVILGAKYGIGTAIFAFCTGPIMQFIYKKINFNVSGIEHVYIDEIIKRIKNKEMPPDAKLSEIIIHGEQKI